MDGRLVLLLSSCAAYAIAWWQHRRLAAVAAKPWYPWLVGIAMAGGTLLQGMAPWLPSSGVGNVMLCAGSGAMALGAALFIVELSRVFAQLGSRFALLAGVVGLFGCTVPFFLATVMSDVGKGRFWREPPWDPWLPGEQRCGSFPGDAFTGGALKRNCIFL